MPSVSAPTMVKLRLLEKMTMLMMSSCTIMGVPRMMVVYTLQMALKKPSTGLRVAGALLVVGRAHHEPPRMPSTMPSASAMAVTSSVVPTPSDVLHPAVLQDKGLIKLDKELLPEVELGTAV